HTLSLHDALPISGVQGWVVDHRVEERLERAAELGTFAVAELDQVAPVHGEVGESVRLRPLLLEQLAKALGRALALLPSLAGQVGVLVRDEVERQVVAVLAEEA